MPEQFTRMEGNNVEATGRQPRAEDPLDRRPAYPIEGVTYHSADDASRFLSAGDWIRLTIGEATRIAAERDPEGAAIVSDSGTVSYRALDQRTESSAAALLRLGLTPGDRVLFQVGTAADFFWAFLACQKAGLIPICTLPQHRDHELDHYAQLCGPRAMIVQPGVQRDFDQVDFAKSLAARHGDLEYVISTTDCDDDTLSLQAMGRAYEASDARLVTQRVRPNHLDVAVFQLSGGSTAAAKVIPRMHGEYLGASQRLGERFDLRSADSIFWGLPLIHNAGMLYAVLPTVLNGRRAVLHPSANVEAMLDAISDYGVTFTGSIGPIAARLLELPDGDLGRLKSLDQFFSLNRSADIERRTGVTCSNQFGMTEGVVLASGRSANLRVRHETVGHPVSALDEVVLRDPETGKDVKSGTVGNYVLKVPIS